MRDPQLERNIRRSQKQIESYHQLRATVAKVGGKKELTGKNDIETDISNKCGQLISNASVYYNSAILLRLLERLEAEGNAKGIEALTRISTVYNRNRRHSHLGGVSQEAFEKASP